MAASHATFLRSGAGLSALATMVLGLCNVAKAQDHTPDPYKPYNAAYESFVYPVYPGSEGYYPNQGVLNGRTAMSRSNQFQDFLDDLDASDRPGEGGRRRGGLGIPYYEASRGVSDTRSRRADSPSATRDDQFYADQQARHDSYIKYLRERDPKKRAELYREYMQGSSRLSRELSSVRGRTESTSSKKASANRLSAEAGAGRSGAAVKKGASTKPRAKAAPSSGRGPAPKSETPSDILKRSKEMENKKTVTPSPSSPPARTPATPR